MADTAVGCRRRAHPPLAALFVDKGLTVEEDVLVERVMELVPKGATNLDISCAKR